MGERLFDSPTKGETYDETYPRTAFRRAPPLGLHPKSTLTFPILWYN